MMKTIITAMVLLCLLGCSKGNPEATPKEEAGTKMEIDLQWGGFYATKEKDEDQYGVIRLLDFNRYVYHVAIFQEKFSEVPNLEDVVDLAPYIGHAPIDSKALLREREIHLLGGSALTDKDLEGYRFYLEHHEVKRGDIEELFCSVIEFSNQPPLELTLEVVDGELEITER
jgi:hypothetical protein